MESSITPFDIQRMFIDTAQPLFILEIVFRVIVMYIFAVVLMRFMGSRGTNQLSPLEYVLIIAMGSAAGDPMFYPQVPILYALVVIGVMVTLNRALARIKKHKRVIRDIIEPKPKIVVKDGVLIDSVLEADRYSKNEIYSQLRQKGIRFLEEVDIAILEESGRLSVYQKHISSARKLHDLSNLEKY